MAYVPPEDEEILVDARLIYKTPYRPYYISAATENELFRPCVHNCEQLVAKITSVPQWVIDNPQSYKNRCQQFMELYNEMSPTDLTLMDIMSLSADIDDLFFHGLLYSSHGHLVDIRMERFDLDYDERKPNPDLGLTSGITLADMEYPPKCTIVLSGPFNRDYERIMRLSKVSQLSTLVHEMVHAYINCYFNWNRDEEHLVGAKEGGHGPVFHEILEWVNALLAKLDKRFQNLEEQHPQVLKKPRPPPLTRSAIQNVSDELLILENLTNQRLERIEEALGIKN
ncbi:uncharacterized protein F4822DRAFT_289550 [Hypoxylon trugodes]|uniref:uncharacterized protein n=1 Tax=Hypoxylon trugodes TaxID=326681 RepID=UPI0021925D5A|nr:uncharacterized protein F4822DRAFT_289550 [Hypoxylon trugodes]KAI1387650.1 hypothetical protein F4822DRAFT_289550 [Hypoxylon trugodes]